MTEEMTFESIVSWSTYNIRINHLGIDIRNIPESKKVLPYEVIVDNTNVSIDVIRERYELAQQIADYNWFWSNPSGSMTGDSTIFLFVHKDDAARFKLSV